MMVQFMPMRKSAFFDKSKGFATMPMMQFCLVLKTAQSSVSVICQIAYLVTTSDLDSPTTSDQAKALFFLNILTAFMGAVMGVLLLCLKQKYLREEDKRRQSARTSAVLDMANMYDENSTAGDDVEPMANPMHHTTPGEATVSYTHLRAHET